jgi:LacI family transcriptional regulator
MSVTIKDIARAAQVSINTVSRALNDKDDVNAETKARIIHLARELNYTPNFLAKSLHSKQTKTIGVVVTDNANPFYASVIKGIEDFANSRGYSIILTNTDETIRKEKKALTVLKEKRVDGILITPARTTAKNIQDLKKLNTPFMIVNRSTEDSEINYIKTDNVHGGYLGVMRLLETGRKRMVYLAGPNTISSVQERYTGGLKALREYGLLGEHLPVYVTNLKINGGYEVMKNLLESADIPNGVFAYSDLIAIGAMRAIREKGLHIPRDIAVVGYDDIELSSYLEVRLTTVRQPCFEIGKRAAEELIHYLENKNKESMGDKKPVHILLQPELVIRDSA